MERAARASRCASRHFSPLPVRHRRDCVLHVFGPGCHALSGFRIGAFVTVFVPQGERPSGCSRGRPRPQAEGCGRGASSRRYSWRTAGSRQGARSRPGPRPCRAASQAATGADANRCPPFVDADRRLCQAKRKSESLNPRRHRGQIFDFLSDTWLTMQQAGVWRFLRALHWCRLGKAQHLPWQCQTGVVHALLGGRQPTLASSDAQAIGTPSTIGANSQRDRRL